MLVDCETFVTSANSLQLKAPSYEDPLTQFLHCLFDRARYRLWREYLVDRAELGPVLFLGLAHGELRVVLGTEVGLAT